MYSIAAAAASCGLTVNAAKTELMELYPLQMQSTLAVEFDGVVLNSQTAMRSLGVCLDSHLDFINHVGRAVARCEKPLFALRRAACKYGGATQHFYATIYQRVLIPMLLYAVAIWCPACYLLLNK